MNINDTEIPEVKIITPNIYTDSRGFFFESFNQKVFENIIGKKINFVQDNHSFSKKGVLRGLHFQKPPFEQGKLVRVVKGEVFDVAVDIRKNSSNCGKWVGVILSDENRRQLWIPEGFAHGFLTLSDNAEFLYKTTNYYNSHLEGSIKWDDEFLAINWPSELIELSEKDKNAELFCDYLDSCNNNI